MLQQKAAVGIEKSTKLRWKGFDGLIDDQPVPVPSPRPRVLRKEYKQTYDREQYRD
jgi:hypothetical protein